MMTQTSTQYQKLVVFGDGFSACGNFFRTHHVPARPPYFAGRFSPGPIWTEYLAQRMGLVPDGVENFVVGGATTGTANVLSPGAAGLLTQVMTYVSAREPLAARGLYSIWAGCDEFLHALWAGGPRFFHDMDRPTHLLMTAVSNVMTALHLLVSGGARSFLLPTMPALGQFPQVQQHGDQAFVAGATALAVTYNATLRQELGRFASEHAVTVLPLDVFTLLENIATCSDAVHRLIAKGAYTTIQAGADREWAGGATACMPVGAA